MVLQRPPHIYLDESWYMITAATMAHQPALAGDETKSHVRDALRDMVQHYHFRLLAWVILDNHYHLVLKTRRGLDLTRFVAQLHGGTSRRINLASATPHRKIWRNYWDSMIRGEADLWTRFNYIHHNPVKHGYVARAEEWASSSYHYYLRKRGLEWLQDCWLRYPIVDFTTDDGF